MRGTADFIARRATSRGIALAALIVVVLTLIVRFALIPAYRDITGFVPFDAHARLSRVMIGIELGAFPQGAATGVYIVFALVDIARAAAAAWLFVLAWRWLFEYFPARLSGFLSRGGILLVPVYVVALDIAAKVGFFRLLESGSVAAHTALVDFSVMAHRMGFALADARNYLTVGFILIAAIGFWRRMRAARRM
jgi:hypothetical protein